MASKYVNKDYFSLCLQLVSTISQQKMGAFSQIWSLIKDCSLLVEPPKLQTVTGKFTISKLTGNTSKENDVNPPSER